MQITMHGLSEFVVRSPIRLAFRLITQMDEDPLGVKVMRAQLFYTAEVGPREKNQWKLHQMVLGHLHQGLIMHPLVYWLLICILIEKVSPPRST